MKDARQRFIEREQARRKTLVHDMLDRGRQSVAWDEEKCCVCDVPQPTVCTHACIAVTSRVGMSMRHTVSA